MIKRISCLAVLVFSLATFQTALATDQFDLPDDLQKLMPADAAAIIAVSSLNELANQFEIMSQALDEESTASRQDIIDILDGELARFDEMVDPDRPLAMTVGLPNLMSGEEPPFVIILPLRDSFKDRDNIGAGNARFESHAVAGDYFALASSPGYVFDDAVPALAGNLAAGIVSFTLDLELVALNFGPFIEMGLAGIPTRPDDAVDDGSGSMTRSEAAAMAKVVREVLAAATHLDLSLARDGDLVKWYTGLGFKPDSVLDPGPQPDFKRALALTQALPRDADIHQVIAVDQTRLFTVFEDYYTISMKSAVSGMDEDHAADYLAWMTDYFTTVEIWANPMAAALQLKDEGMAAHLIMETDEAQATLDRFTEIITGINDLDIGYILTRQDDEEIGGVQFRRWDIDFDLEKFEAVMAPETAPAMTGTARMQAEQMIAVLRKIMPRLHLGAKGDKLFIASDDNTEALAAMVKAAGKGGQPQPDIAEIARDAGPACQQVISGDLLAIFNWATEMLADMDPEQQFVVADNPIGFEATVTIEEAALGFDMGVGLSALSGLLQAIEEMEPN